TTPVSLSLFTATATAQPYTLSLHDALPISNNSYLVDPWAQWCSTDPDQAAVATALRRALAYSDRQGVVSVVAAGNGELDLTAARSEEHTSELQSRFDLVCRLLLEKKKNYVK